MESIRIRIPYPNSNFSRTELCSCQLLPPVMVHLYHRIPSYLCIIWQNTPEIASCHLGSPCHCSVEPGCHISWSGTEPHVRRSHCTLPRPTRWRSHRALKDDKPGMIAHYPSIILMRLIHTGQLSTVSLSQLMLKLSHLYFT